MTDRPAGILLLITGLAVAAEASTFDVSFPTDPVGPKALPYLSALVFVLAGALLAARPGPRAPGPPRAVLARMGGALAAFGVYAAALAPLGFVVATTGTVTTLSLLFGGPWRKALAAAFALSVVLWYLFVWLLALPLPLGSAWEALWMR